ncbi:MAG TPA: response regulator [Vicinamibacterales bacterium]|nr:response regulator [Vicinamibacterales bacterium]
MASLTQTARHPVRGPHRCAVLVVEDEPELQALVRFALEADGCEVSVAGDGREALKHLRSTASTCLIILDLFLPVMSGRRFRAAQLRDRSLAWIPVLILSGGVEGAREARELGACAFVRKPVDVDELRAAVKRIDCGHQRHQVEQRAPAEPGAN